MKKSVITKTLFAILSLVFSSSVAIAADGVWKKDAGAEVYHRNTKDTSCCIKVLGDGKLELIGVKYGKKTLHSRFSISSESGSIRMIGYNEEAITHKSIWTTPAPSNYNVFLSECYESTTHTEKISVDVKEKLDMFFKKE